MLPVFVKAAADLVWALAWADHAEEHECESLSGVNIYDVMPETPEVAFDVARKILAEVEKRNECRLRTLWARACDADPKVRARASDHKLMTRFAECLVYESMGHGVSWEDDYKAFERADIYMGDDGEARIWADAHCEHGKFTPTVE